MFRNNPVLIPVFILGFLIVAATFMTSTRKENLRASATFTEEVKGPEQPDVDDNPSTLYESLMFTEDRLQNGEPLANFLRRHDLPDSVVNALTYTAGEQVDLRRLAAGSRIELGWLDTDLREVRMYLPEDEILLLMWDRDRFVGDRFKLPVDTYLAKYEGNVESSVYESILEDGGTPQLAILFFEIFQFTHYFTIDTRAGDHYSMIVEELWRDGERVGYGKVWAARYAGHFDTLTAVWRSDGRGLGEYFSLTGQSFRRDLLRVPFPAARITSTFGPRRHPVTGKRRMHHGVDLSARRGTPVVAAGRGTVTRAERNHPGYGNWVHIKHGDTSFETRYGHFQSIARGIYAGKKVEQGDVIGYVGSTGMTTGPHLHYEVFRDGKRMNPLRVKGSPVQQLSPDELSQFLMYDYLPWSYLLDEDELFVRTEGLISPRPSLFATAFLSAKKGW